MQMRRMSYPLHELPLRPRSGRLQINIASGVAHRTYRGTDANSDCLVNKAIVRPIDGSFNKSKLIFVERPAVTAQLAAF
jgi:hypothetical protein